MSKQSDKAIDQLFILADTLRAIRVKQASRQWGVSTTTAATIIDPTRPHVLQATAPWRNLKHPGLRRLAKRITNPVRTSRRGPRSTEKIFANERPNNTPDWYTDLNAPLPEALVRILNR